MATEAVKMSELRTGDIVETGVGRVLLGELHTYVAHDTGATVYSFAGTILGFAPEDDDVHHWVRGVNRGYGEDADWRVQGNDLRTVEREV